MATEITEYDFERTAGDTYPEIMVLRFDDGIRVNLEDGWSVYLDIKEDVNGDGTVYKNVRIIGEIVPFSDNEVAFYPRTGYSFDYDNPGSPLDYVAFSVSGRHSFSVVREKLFYYANDSGTYVYLEDTDTYELYDVGNPLHAGLDKLSQYTEIMTHQEGYVTVKDRLGW